MLNKETSRKSRDKIHRMILIKINEWENLLTDADFASLLTDLELELRRRLYR